MLQSFLCFFKICRSRNHGELLKTKGKAFKNRNNPFLQKYTLIANIASTKWSTFIVVIYDVYIIT